MSCLVHGTPLLLSASYSIHVEAPLFQLLLTHVALCFLAALCTRVLREELAYMVNFDAANMCLLFSLVIGAKFRAGLFHVVRNVESRGRVDPFAFCGLSGCLWAAARCILTADAVCDMDSASGFFSGLVGHRNFVFY